MWISLRAIVARPGALFFERVKWVRSRFITYCGRVSGQNMPTLQKRACKTIDFIERSICKDSRVYQDEVASKSLLDRIEEYKTLKSSLDHLSQILDVASCESDRELWEDALKELENLNYKLYALWLKIVCKHPDTPGCYIEIVCGAGGQESCDWVATSRDMYIRWASRYELDSRIMNEEVEGQGCRSCVIEVSGKYAYDFLKNETGVHRFTRVSPYGGGTKIHTSFISVKVIPIINEFKTEVQSEKDIRIEPKDIRVEFMKARGPGGQHVNKTESAVRIVHIPTRMIVSCQSERSQHYNKEQAFNILRSRLYALQEEKIRRQKAKLHSEEPDASWGGKVRNYTVLRNAVKDFRTGLEIKDFQKVLSGEGLHEFMEESLVLNGRDVSRSELED